MSKSGYVCAGFETLSSIVDRFIKNEKGMYKDNFTRSDISNFLGKTCSGFLHSYGQNFTNKKSYNKYNKNEANLFKKCKDTGFFENSNLIVDSGGFQASIGRINENETRLLIDLYYKFLVDHQNVYDRAFILDLPPGPGCKLFDNFEDIYKLNLETYDKAANLPSKVRDKIIYIHHFRTPKLWEIYSKILIDNNLFDKFKYHGTGGIVANMSSDASIPCIIYILPIIPLLNQAIKFNKKELNFHILGGANFRDILFYETFKIHVMKKHNIDLNITYDSSGIFKGLMVGRYIPILENGKISKLDLRSKSSLKVKAPYPNDIDLPGANHTPLGFRHYNNVNCNLKKIDIFRNLINQMSTKHNFKKINMTKIYSDETGTFSTDVGVYAMLYMLDLYSEVQTFLKAKAKDLYKLYENNDLEKYGFDMLQLAIDINNNKVTKKQSSKITALYKSLNMLTDLSEEYCKKLVDKHLSKDEFNYMSEMKYTLPKG